MQPLQSRPLASPFAGLAVSIVASVMIIGCASNPSLAPTTSWDESCYPGFEADVQVLAGAQAASCGIVERGASTWTPRQAARCIRGQLESGAAFRAAHASFGYDSLFCDAVARDESGQIWSVFYDFDVTGQFGTDGRNHALSVSRCESVELEPGTIGPGSYFRILNCKEDRDALRQVIQARRQVSAD